MKKLDFETRFQQYWEALQKKAEELGMNTQALLEPTPGHDWGDTAAAATEKEMAAAFITVRTNTKVLVQWAIQRLMRDEYGTCVHCEAEIPERRLNAIPWTPLCIRCQELAENGKLRGFNCVVGPNLTSRLNAVQ